MGRRFKINEQLLQVLKNRPFLDDFGIRTSMEFIRKVEESCLPPPPPFHSDNTKI